jgi:branched-chain amino acid transport system ATP-binding protein
VNPVLEAVGLGKCFGGLVVTEDVTLDARPHEIHAIIGPNGAGKTTLLNQIGGQIRPDRGSIRIAGTDITALPPSARARLGLQRTFQVPRVFASFSVAQNPAVSGIGHERSSFRFWRPLGNIAELQETSHRALAAVGLPVSKKPAAQLSHGDRRLLEVAMVIAMSPTVVLLDEPMAGLGHTESQAMIELLLTLAQRAAIVLVEHDMDAVFRLAHRVTVLVSGRVICTGKPDRVRQDKAVRAAYLGDSHV